MLNRAVEEGHLLKARSHVVAATARIAHQCLIIARLRARGLDTRQAEACLQTMQNSLRALGAHKELIRASAGISAGDGFTVTQRAMSAGGPVA